MYKIIFRSKIPRVLFKLEFNFSFFDFYKQFLITIFIERKFYIIFHKNYF